MADLPILFVAGLGRCGTTMMMTMLDAGGFPVSGPRPAYEVPDRWQAGRPDMAWLRAQAGRAVKWLNPPQHFTLPGRLSVRPVIILMERSPKEQARSQLKLLSSIGVGIGDDRRVAKPMERSIRRDMPVMRAHLGSPATFPFRFEDVLEFPGSAARLLGKIVAAHFGAGFDDAAAARVVQRRAPQCLPDMAMENHILPLIAAHLGGRP